MWVHTSCVPTSWVYLVYPWHCTHIMYQVPLAFYGRAMGMRLVMAVIQTCVFLASCLLIRERLSHKHLDFSRKLKGEIENALEGHSLVAKRLSPEKLWQGFILHFSLSLSLHVRQWIVPARTNSSTTWNIPPWSWAAKEAETHTSTMLPVCETYQQTKDRT